jgi:hypothetical protein
MCILSAEISIYYKIALSMKFKFIKKLFSNLLLSVSSLKSNEDTSRLMRKRDPNVVSNEKYVGMSLSAFQMQG